MVVIYSLNKFDDNTEKELKKLGYSKLVLPWTMVLPEDEKYLIVQKESNIYDIVGDILFDQLKEEIADELLEFDNEEDFLEKIRNEKIQEHTD